MNTFELALHALSCMVTYLHGGSWGRWKAKSNRVGETPRSLFNDRISGSRSNSNGNSRRRSNVNSYSRNDSNGDNARSSQITMTSGR
jgi:hypothetical protein